MTSWWWILVVILPAYFLIRRLSLGGFNSRLTHAHRTGEIGALVGAIVAAVPKDQPTLWDQALGSLWQAYHRETATHLVMQAAQHSEADIVQFWIKKVMEVEPEIATAHFTEDFLAQHFRPDVAARCGRKGCC